MAYVEQLRPSNNMSDLPKYVSSPKVARREPVSLTRERSFEQDTLEQGALINIVAAVNEGAQAERDGKAGDGLALGTFSNTMALLSNLMAPRNRTVSIPRVSLQKSFVLPEKVVQRKPVYYKHSDNEVKRDSQARLFEVRTSFPVRSRQQSNRSVKSNPERTLKGVPPKSVSAVHSFIYDPPPVKQVSDGLAMPSQRERDARSMSPVRRLGALKRSDSRQTHSVAKCNAVDLMDTSGNTPCDTSPDELDLAKAVLDDSRKLIPHTLENNIPFYRNKSLPVVFPAKTSKPVRSNLTPQPKQRLYKNKPISKHYVTQKPESMYSRVMSMPSGFGYGTLAIGNGVNQDPDIYSPMCHDSNKTERQRMPFAGIISQRSSWRNRSAGTSTVTISPDSSRMYAASVFSSGDTDSHADNRSSLHSAVRSAMTSRPTSVPSNVDSSGNTRSCMSGRQRDGQEDGKSSTKQVHFEEDDMNSGSSVCSFNNDETKEQAASNGGSSIIQTHATWGRTYSPGIQPMSAQELLRFKQKIIPNNSKSSTVHQQSYFTTSSGIKIKTKTSETNVKLFANEEPEQQCQNNTQDEKISEVETEREYFEAENKPESESEMIAKNTANSDNEDFNDGRSRRSDSNTQSDMHKSPKPNDETKQDFYKLVKAVDMHSYSGYEHKKLRKMSGTHGRGHVDKTAHFVRVKIG